MLNTMIRSLNVYVLSGMAILVVSIFSLSELAKQVSSTGPYQDLEIKPLTGNIVLDSLGAVGMFEFNIKNNSRYTYHLLGSRSFCDCIRLTGVPRNVSPGQTQQFTVILKAEGLKENIEAPVQFDLFFKEGEYKNAFSIPVATTFNRDTEVVPIPDPNT